MPIHSPEHQAAIGRYNITGDPTELKRLGIPIPGWGGPAPPPTVGALPDAGALENFYTAQQPPYPLDESVSNMGKQFLIPHVSTGFADPPSQSQPPALAPGPQPISPEIQASMLGSFNPTVTQAQPQAPGQAPVDASVPVKHTKPEGFETPRRPAPTDTSTPMWKNPQFWDAAAAAAGPVLGALLAPKPAPNVPTLSSPVAGSGSPSQMQSVLGGPLPIDPRIMRPFG